MSSWSHLIRFRAPDGLSYFASLTSVEDVARIEGQSVLAYATFSELEEGRAGTQTVIELVIQKFQNRLFKTNKPPATCPNTV
jgi:hypothetical protein